MSDKIKAYNAWFEKGKEEGIKEYKQRVKEVFDEMLKDVRGEESTTVMNSELQNMGVDTRCKTVTMHYWTEETIIKKMKELGLED